MSQIRLIYPLLLFIGVIISCSKESTPDIGETQTIEEVSSRLSNLKVKAIAEDSYGHIWMGTFRGLNKYDAQNYYQYFSQSDTLGLPDNQISEIHNDMSGRLWVATESGLCYLSDEDEFVYLSTEGVIKKCYQIEETSSGKLFFDFNTQISTVSDDRKSLVKVIDNDWSLGDPLIAVSPDQKLWVVYHTLMRCYDTDSCELLWEKPTPFYVNIMEMMDSGELWLSGSSDLAIIDTKNLQYKDIPSSIQNNKDIIPSNIDLMYAIDNYSILINTSSNGLYYYYRNTNTLTHQSESSFPFIVPTSHIISIFRDSQKNIWFGTEDQGFGVSYFTSNRFSGNKYLSNYFQSKSVLSIAADKENNLWISTLNDGLYVYDQTRGDIKRVPLNNLLGISSNVEVKNSGVYVDDRGYLWILFPYNSLAVSCKYDGGKLHLKDKINVLFPFCVSQDDNGNIWIGGSNSQVIKYDYKTLTAESIPAFDSWTFTTSISPLGDGKVLLCAYAQPLKVYDTNHNQFISIDGLTDGDINSFIKKSLFIPSSSLKSSFGDIWIGTVTNGVIHYDASLKKLSSFDDVPCSDISAICEDKQGNIWISTLNGICKYDKDSGTSIKYYEDDGIGGSQFCDRSSLVLADGSLIFGGSHGITWFNPLDIPQKRTVPLVFEELKVHNEIVNPGKHSPIGQSLSKKPQININHKQNGFSISFAALDYSEKGTHYHYKLDGFDEYWVDAGFSNEAYYANVPAGRYQFKVRISNNNQSINEVEESIVVRIHPSPLESPLAYIIYFILLVCALYAIYRVWQKFLDERTATQVARADQEREKRINQMQMDFFTNVAHEFRTPLTTISGPVTMLNASDTISNQDRRLLGVVSRSVDWMLNLVNQLLDFNKLENDSLKLHVRKSDVISELNQIFSLFEYNAKKKNIELSTSGIEDSYVMWIDGDKLRKIVLNLMSNALKFTPIGGKIKLSFNVLSRDKAKNIFTLSEADKDSQYALISVADTGIGIPEDQVEKIFERYYQLDNQQTGKYNSGSGIGLYYSRTLAELHHGYLKAGNREDGEHGAVFSLLLPINAISYTEQEKSVDTLEQIEVYPLDSVSNGIVEEMPSEEDIQASKKKVLVVDDDIDVANYLRILLSNTYSVVCCFDAESALKKISEEEPDIILSDVMMPGTDGYQLCHTIKQDSQLCHIPVILVTAKVTIGDQIKGLGEGADAYVTKPFDPIYLLTLLKTQLENKGKTQRILGAVTDIDSVDDAVLTPADNLFMKELYEIMDHELSNPDLDITRMTEKMKISRTKLYYKVKGLTGENPSVFFRRYKLNRAAQLLLEGKYNMSEIADMTGFSSLSHFSTSFKKQFGVPPSEYKG